MTYCSLYKVPVTCKFMMVRISYFTKISFVILYRFSFIGSVCEWVYSGGSHKSMVAVSMKEKPVINIYDGR